MTVAKVAIPIALLGVVIAFGVRTTPDRPSAGVTPPPPEAPLAEGSRANPSPLGPSEATTPAESSITTAPATGLVDEYFLLMNDLGTMGQEEALSTGKELIGRAVREPPGLAQLLLFEMAAVGGNDSSLALALQRAMHNILIPLWREYPDLLDRALWEYESTASVGVQNLLTLGLKSYWATSGQDPDLARRLRSTGLDLLRSTEDTIVRGQLAASLGGYYESSEEYKAMLRQEVLPAEPVTRDQYAVARAAVTSLLRQEEYRRTAGIPGAPTTVPEDSREEMAAYLEGLFLDPAVPLEHVLWLALEIHRISPTKYADTLRRLVEADHPATEHPRLMEMLERVGG